VPFCQLRQSAHTGRKPAWKSAYGCCIVHVVVPLLHVQVM
jgi:hypothetical protein